MSEPSEFIKDRAARLGIRPQDCNVQSVESVLREAGIPTPLAHRMALHEITGLESPLKSLIFTLVEKSRLFTVTRET
jgi:hypothetical protein